MARIVRGIGDIVQRAIKKSARPVRNIATGYLSAKIANTQANDELKADIFRTAGTEYLTEEKPEFEKIEKSRANEFKAVSAYLGNEKYADYFDANGFNTGDGEFLNRVKDFMKKHKIRNDQWERYIPVTNYEDRYKTRAKSFNEKYDEVFKEIGMKNVGGVGPNTLKSLLKTMPEDQELTQEVTIPGTEDKYMGPEEKGFMVEGTPETSEIQTVERYTAATPTSELFTTIPESEGKMEPQFRLRMNDAVGVSLDSMGLSGKYKVGLDGNLDVTNFDEADNAKYGYASELINNEFLQPNFDTRTYQLVGSNVGTYIENYERDIVNAHNTYSTALYNSPASTQPQGDAAYKIFLDTPEMATLLMRYARGSRAERKLIEAKFGKSYSYSEFFAKYLDELAPE